MTVRAHDGHPIHSDPDRMEQRIAEAVAGALRAEVTVEWDLPF